jgi:hypothetical protein
MEPSWTAAILKVVQTSRAGEATCAAGLGGKAPPLQPGELLFRAGRRNKEHLVGIQAGAGFTTFQLVYTAFSRKGQDQ